jgi:hypothetical protein
MDAVIQAEQHGEKARLKTASIQRESELDAIKQRLLIARFCPSFVGIEERLDRLEQGSKLKIAKNKTIEPDNSHIAAALGL